MIPERVDYEKHFIDFGGVIVVRVHSSKKVGTWLKKTLSIVSVGLRNSMLCMQRESKQTELNRHTN